MQKGQEKMQFKWKPCRTDTASRHTAEEDVEKEERRRRAIDKTNGQQLDEARRARRVGEGEERRFNVMQR